VRVWRLTRKQHLDKALTGEGARRFGGRWNGRGVPIVYTSESLELALLEALVHIDVDALPRDYWQVSFEIPDKLIAPSPQRLPTGWDALPPYRPGVQKVGDAWVKSNGSLALRVPASVLPERFNVLVNPAHPDIARVREVSRAKLSWPPRLVGHLQAAMTNRRS
jgi:RES domain-containing protein